MLLLLIVCLPHLSFTCCRWVSVWGEGSGLGGHTYILLGLFIMVVLLVGPANTCDVAGICQSWWCGSQGGGRVCHCWWQWWGVLAFAWSCCIQQAKGEAGQGLTYLVFIHSCSGGLPSLLGPTGAHHSWWCGTCILRVCGFQWARWGWAPWLTWVAAHWCQLRVVVVNHGGHQQQVLVVVGSGSGWLTGAGCCSQW